MLQYRGFLLYSYKSEQFIFSLKRDIQGDSVWFSELNHMIEKLKQAEVIEEKWFQYESCVGKVRGKYDIFNQRFLILISKHNIDDIESTQLLHEIFAYLIDKPLYNQELIQDLEIACKYDIEQIIQLKERQYTHNIKTDKTLSNFICFQQKNQEQADKQKPIFKGFMIFDLKKEYFFMLIKRGFENNHIWQQQRLKIQNILTRIINEKEFKHFSFTGELGEFQFDYCQQAKCYLILLVDPQFPYYPQRQLLNKINKLITTTEPTFLKQSKLELEKRMLVKIADLINFEELNYLQQLNVDVVDELNSTHQDYNKIRSLTEIPDCFLKQNKPGSRSEQQFPYMMSDDKISQSFIF